MANRIYPKYKKAELSGGLNTNLVTGAAKALLVASAYTYDDAHEFLSDIPSGDRISQSGALTSKAVTDLAAFQSGNARFDAVTGAACNAIILWIDTGALTTSRLVAYIDTGVTGLPVTPAGASYNLIVDPAGWFVE